MPENEPVKMGEFQRAMDAQTQVILDGFNRITHRQDIANGRTNTHERLIGAQGAMIEALEKNVGRLMMIPIGTVQASPDKDGQATLALRMDKKMAGIILALLAFLQFAISMLATHYGVGAEFIKAMKP